MASAWGYSWGLAFGRAWGLISALVEGPSHPRRMRIPAANRRLRVVLAGRVRVVLLENRTYAVAEAAARRISIAADERISLIMSASRKVFK